MYKNFNLSEEEKKQILEQHKSHGYKKPISEQEIDEPQQNLVIKSMGLMVTKVMVNINLSQSSDENDSVDDVRVPLVKDMHGDWKVDLGGIEVNEDEISYNQVKNLVMEKLSEGYFNNLIPNYIDIDTDSGKLTGV